MDSKQFLLDSIKHKSISRIPTMYRGDPATNKKLINYFNLSDIKKDWKKLLKKIGADNARAFLFLYPADKVVMHDIRKMTGNSVKD